MKKQLAYLNGQFMPLEQAKVPIEDRGYQFSDGVYEVFVTYRGQYFLLEQHLKRLEASAQGIRLTLPHTREAFAKIAHKGLEQSGLDDALVYLQITRGCAPRQHAIKEDIPPQVVMTFKPKPPNDPAWYKEGVSVMTLPETRWQQCQYKTISLLPNTLARQQAQETGFFEAIFVGKDNKIHEGAASNLFLLCNDTVITPVLSDFILPGITRQVILENLPAWGFEAQERPVTLDELEKANGIFLTSTSMNIVPVVKINETRVGSSEVGPAMQQLMNAYQDLREAACCQAD